jgi:Flp pilus assembly protein TadG
MRTDNRGQVLVIVALAFVVFLGFAALAVDVAYMYNVRSELQRCADAGALAGASAYVDPDVLGDRNLEAIARVKDFVSRNTVAGATLDSNNPRILSIQVPPANLDNQVSVAMHLTVNLFFARIFGRDSTMIQAAAAANHSPVDNTLILVE